MTRHISDITLYKKEYERNQSLWMTKDTQVHVHEASKI